MAIFGTRKENLIIVLGNGVEVIGKVAGMTDHTVTLRNPCLLPDIQNLLLMSDFVFYYKEPVVTFNRDTLIAEYEPCEEILDLYNGLINHEVYAVSRKLVMDSIAKEIKMMQTVDKAGIEALLEVIAKAKEMATSEEFVDIETDEPKPKFSGPKVLEIDDIVKEINKAKGKSKKHH